MKKAILKVILPALLFSGLGNLYAQVLPRFSHVNFASEDSIKRKPILLIQAEMENGGMIPNNSQIRETFSDIYYSGFNLRVGWQTEGKNIYHRAYNYPVYGVGFYRSTFRKPEIGTPHAIYGFVSVPVSPERFKKWDFNYRIALGLANNFHAFDPVDNPLNTLLGSSRNVYIDFGFQTNYRLGEHLQLGLGLAFHHFSNGSMRQPNKGINLIPLGLSVTYKPSSRKPNFLAGEIPEAIKKNHFHLSWAWGLKQFDPDNRKQYFKTTLGTYWSTTLGYKWRLGLGADIYYSDSGNYEEIAGDKRGRFGSLFSGGPAMYIDHMLMDNLYINGNVGHYIHKNKFNGEVKPVFLKLGVRYRFRSNIFAGVSIKAHQGKADFVEWTLGMTLPAKKRSVL